MIKWKKSEAFGWSNVDVDVNIWCPCDESKDAEYLRMQDSGSGGTVACPKCGKVYRLITKVLVQEMITDETKSN